MSEVALVTGGCGLIGSHIVDLLLAEGWQVRILDSLHPQTHPNGPPPWMSPWIASGVECIQGDVRDWAVWQRALDGVDVVWHQAAEGGFQASAVPYLTANAVGTATLFEAVGQYAPGCRRVVVASSQAVYGEGVAWCPSGEMVYPRPRSTAQLAAGHWQHACPTHGHELRPDQTPERTPPDPLSPYGVSKLAEERIALVLGRQIGIPTVCLRYAVTYGPRQSLHNPYTGIVSIFANRLRNGLPCVIYEDGRQLRDFIAVADVARANLAASSDRVPSGAYNVGTGRGRTVQEIVQAVAQAIGQPCRAEIPGLYRPGDVRAMIHDPTAFMHAADWCPQAGLSDGLAQFAQWFGEQPPVPDSFDAAQEGLRAAGVVVGA